MRGIIDKEYDWVVINNKTGFDGKGILPDDIEWIRSLRCHKALFINKAKASALADQKVMDLVDVIFKRELLKDLDRYHTDELTRRKLHVTMLACPLVCVRRGRHSRLIRKERARDLRVEADAAAVSFVGRDNSRLRRDVLMSLAGSNCGFAGGLYGDNGKELEWDGPRSARQSVEEYVSLVYRSRVNLALDGIGVFTFRHLELWNLGVFMLSSPGIRDVHLPGEDPVEGEHFICFDGMADLVEKISYYASHDDERTRIGAAGREFFQRIYNFGKHGQYIREVFERHMR